MKLTFAIHERESAMKRWTAIGVIALALASGGCSSLRPPAQDREVWEAQQKEQVAKNAADPAGQALSAGYELGMLGYFLSGVARW